MAPANKESSSARAKHCNSCEAALVNRVESNGARRRTTHSPPERKRRWPNTAARICRFRRVRVTERRACFLGTTVPSQSRPSAPGSDAEKGTTRLTSGDSSTALHSAGAAPVDKSWFATARFGLAGTLGQSARWCTAKCAVLARLGVRRTRSKSAVRTSRPITRTGPGRSSSAARACSDSQALAALGAARIDDSATPTGLHSHKEAMRACTAYFGSLVGAFHGRFCSCVTRFAHSARPWMGEAAWLRETEH